MTANFETLQQLEALSAACHEMSVERGFWDGERAIVDDHPSMLLALKAKRIALIHSELSECLEAIRKPQQDEHCSEFTSEEIELADAVIRIMDYAGGYGLRLAQAIIAKYTYNHSRPYKHGKAF